MRILFVNPPVSKKDRYGALAAAGSYSPPLALTNLAAVTRERGWETAIIDAQVEELGHDETISRIDAFRPDIVGITSTTSTFPSGAELAELVKELDRRITVIAGGVHVSALPERSLLEHRAIDAVVLGEGEETVAELVAALKEGSPLEEVRGLALRKGEKVVFTGPRPLIQDLDSLPLPAWEMLPRFPRAYCIQTQSVANFPSTSVCTSRGCTGKCTFCDRRIFGSNLRAHSAPYVMALIKDLYHNHGVRDIQFEDDNFMLFKKRLFEVCDMIRAERLDLTWSCQARVDMVRLETLKKMKEAGCWMILYGVESGSERILKMMKKEISREKILRAIDLAHKAGIMCKGFFITGFLGEDRESLDETYEFIKRAPFDDISLHYYTPFPGSPAYNSVERYGLFKKDFKTMTYYKPVFIPKGLTERDLIDHSKRCYRSFYLRPRTMLNYLRRIKGPGHIIHFAKGLGALVKYMFTAKE